jgi:hypothetical protein
MKNLNEAWEAVCGECCTYYVGLFPEKGEPETVCPCCGSKKRHLNALSQNDSPVLIEAIKHRVAATGEGGVP